MLPHVQAVSDGATCARKFNLEPINLLSIFGIYRVVAFRQHVGPRYQWSENCLSFGRRCEGRSAAPRAKADGRERDDCPVDVPGIAQEYRLMVPEKGAHFMAVAILSSPDREEQTPAAGGVRNRAAKRAPQRYVDAGGDTSRAPDEDARTACDAMARFDLGRPEQRASIRSRDEGG